MPTAATIYNRNHKYFVELCGFHRINLDRIKDTIKDYEIKPHLKNNEALYEANKRGYIDLVKYLLTFEKVYKKANFQILAEEAAYKKDYDLLSFYLKNYESKIKCFTSVLSKYLLKAYYRKPPEKINKRLFKKLLNKSEKIDGRSYPSSCITSSLIHIEEYHDLFFYYIQHENVNIEDSYVIDSIFINKKYSLLKKYIKKQNINVFERFETPDRFLRTLDDSIFNKALKDGILDIIKFCYQQDKEGIIADMDYTLNYSLKHPECFEYIYKHKYTSLENKKMALHAIIRERYHFNEYKINLIKYYIKDRKFDLFFDNNAILVSSIYMENLELLKFLLSIRGNLSKNSKVFLEAVGNEYNEKKLNIFKILSEDKRFNINYNIEKTIDKAFSYYNLEVLEIITKKTGVKPKINSNHISMLYQNNRLKLLSYFKNEIENLKTLDKDFKGRVLESLNKSKLKRNALNF